MASGCLAKMACLSSSLRCAARAFVAFTTTALLFSPAKSRPARSAYTSRTGSECHCIRLSMTSIRTGTGANGSEAKHHTMRISSERSFSMITDCIFVPSATSVVCLKAASPPPPLDCIHVQTQTDQHNNSVPQPTPNTDPRTRSSLNTDTTQM